MIRPRTRLCSFPVPPRRMRHMVKKGSGSKLQFIAEGRSIYESLQGLLDDHSIVVDGGRVLEFGVGCGRVARHFAPREFKSFVGTDVDSELIAWCQANIALRDSRFVFSVNPYRPPLGIGMHSIDFAYSISVFTHLSGDDQLLWIKEMSRVVRPGGYLMASFIEESTTTLPSGITSSKRRDQWISRQWLGHEGAPKQYLTTRSTLDWFTSTADPWFDMIDVRHFAISGKQTIVLLRRK